MWSIARERLPPDASNQTIQTAATRLARENGLPRDAQLRRGQSLRIPDQLVGRVTSDLDVRAGVARLTASTAVATPTSTEAASNTATPSQNLLDLRVQFSDPPRTPLGTVSLPSVAGVPLQGTLERFEGVKTWLNPAALVTTRAVLGMLTPAQFEAVRAALGGLSEVGYAPDRSYELIDFLPPVIQALVNRDVEVPAIASVDGVQFSEGAYVIPDSGPAQVALTMNCHGAAWGAMRAYQGENDKVDVFYGEAIDLDAKVHESADFEKIAEIDGAHVEDLLAADLHPGDLVQFYEVADWMRMSFLLHSAVYVGGGLFFEKPNTETSEADAHQYGADDEADETPFRLATVDNMAQPIHDAVEGHYRVEVLRPKHALPAAEQAFESSLEGDFRRFAEGRGQLLGNQLVSEFEPSLGGGIRCENAAALETLHVSRGESGRGVIDGAVS